MAGIIIFIFIVLIFILDIITMGFLHNLFIKFFIALPLFIIDIIRSDKKVFHGYGFWAFCGLGGSGKTLSIVEYLIRIKERYPNVLILSNFKCDLADKEITSWKDLLNITNINTYEITQKEYDKRLKWGQNHIFMTLDENNNIH